MMETSKARSLFGLTGSIASSIALGSAAISLPALGATQAPVQSDSPAATPDVEPSGYLAGKSIGYVSPPAPDNTGPDEAADLGAVERAQNALDWRRREAFEDAGAYNYDQILPRFSEAAGTQLNVQYYPVLAYVLRRMFVDLTGRTGYVTAAKNAKTRDRPYLEDSSLIPCEIDYLHGLSDHQSYPSGHAAHGLATTLLLTVVMPDRKPLLLERGTRYGDNRVVCGVHHPSDVEEGRRIAQAYFEQVSQDAEFRKEVACAQDERNSVGTLAHPNGAAVRPDWLTLCKGVLGAAGWKAH